MPDANVFLLSPARCDGARAKMLMNPAATFDLAQRLRANDGAPLGEVFSFLSGLYFRGKLTYANAFTPANRRKSWIKIITTDRGLVAPGEHVTRDDLEAFSCVDIAAEDERYLGPLQRDVKRLARTLSADARIVLLGSIATGKYVDILMSVFGERLFFPADFVGRGDMSRGGLLLRHAREGTPLTYIPVSGAIRHGKRPPKLPKLARH